MCLLEERIIGDATYYELVEYERHKNAKNWVAKLIGKDEKYKFKRDFIQIEKFDGDYYIQLENYDIVEVKHIYHSWSGKPYVENHEYYQLVDNTLVNLTEKEVLVKMQELENINQIETRETEFTEEQQGKIDEATIAIENAKREQSIYYKYMSSSVMLYQDNIKLRKQVEELKKEIKILINNNSNEN